MSRLESVEYHYLGFEFYSSQQFATVIFDRDEDSEEVLITVIQDRRIRHFFGNNQYNPSLRRSSSCVYVVEEGSPEDVIKICVIQHKGVTLTELHNVNKSELEYLGLDPGCCDGINTCKTG